MSELALQQEASRTRFELGWNLMLVGVGAVALTASLIFAPGPGETVWLGGLPWGKACDFKEMTGMACPSCGMTRSWVWGIRGHIGRAFVYSPGGLTLLYWGLASGVVGTLRLATGRLELLKLHWKLMAGWLLTWMVVLYLGGWLLRLGGLNPLP